MANRRSRRSSESYGVTRIGSGRRGHLDGDERNAELNRPFGICALRDGILAFTDAHNNAVRFVIPGSSRRSGAATCCVKTVESSGLLTPKGIIASVDHLFVCDTGHHKVKFAALPGRSALADTSKIVDDVEMFVLAGSGKKGWRDGAALEASFNSPAGVCEYTDSTIIVADTGNHCIRRIRRDTSGKMVVKTIAGAYASFQTKGGNGQQPMLGFPAGKRTSGYRDGVHSLFRSPSAIIVGPRSELIVADTMNNCIRGLRPPSVGTSSWIAYTICGQAYPGHADGNSEVALFDQPVSLCWGVNRNSFFVADRGNACVRQVELSYGADLLFSYASVRTIEIGGVRRALRSVQGDWLQQPLGIECIFQQKADAEHAGTPQLVVCDGESNTIKMTPLDQLMHRDSNAEKCFNTTIFSEIETVYNTSPQSRSDPRSWGSSVESLSPETNCTDSEDLSENQFGNDCEACSCESSRALEEALKANALLQAENLRLKELLQCTFDEIELADKRFSENYQPHIDLTPKQ